MSSTGDVCICGHTHPSGGDDGSLPCRSCGCWEWVEPECSERRVVGGWWCDRHHHWRGTDPVIVVMATEP